MTFTDVARMSLELINRYSIGGRVIPYEYNSQKDAVLQIVTLVNDALEYIATNNKRIREYKDYDLEDCEIEDGYLILPCPANYYMLLPGGITIEDGKGIHHVANYKVRKGKILIPKRSLAPAGDWHPMHHGTLSIAYYRHAELMELGADGMPLYPDEELDNTPDTHQVIPYYVASHIAMYDDAYAHATLYNEWIARVNALREEQIVEMTQVQDDYDFFGIVNTLGG